MFPSPNGGSISPDSVNNMLKRVLERAGIPKVRFHDLRHTFATIALQNGVDIATALAAKTSSACSLFIAEKIGKTRQTVSQYVNGISEPGYDTLVKIADHFGVSTDYLLGRSVSKTVDTTAQTN